MESISFIEETAREIRSWLEEAVTDIAYGGHYDSVDIGKMDAKADHLFNDFDTVSDLMGDRIYDAGSGDYRIMISIARELKEIGHETLRNAMDKKIEDWNLRLIKNRKKGEF